jgi:putative transcriptional regulator
MTVRLMIDELLQKRGQTPYWLAKETGIAHSVMHKLRYGKLAAIRFDYIERLCLALECEPGDLFSMKEADARKGKKATKEKRQFDAGTTTSRHRKLLQ